MNNYFDKIVCIHAATSTDRKRLIEGELSRTGTVAEFVEPISVNLGMRNGLTDSMSKELVSLSLTTIAVLQKFMKGTGQTILIIEDDAFFTQDALERLPESKRLWDVLFLGSKYVSGCGYKKTPGVFAVCDPYLGHAYALNRRVIPKIIQAIAELKKPPDICIQRMSQYGELHHVYGFYPNIAHQRPGMSTITHMMVDNSGVGNGY